MVKAKPAGGSKALADLLDKHGDAIYADLLKVYGVDVGIAIDTGYPTPRLLLCLIDHLPLESAYMARISKDRGSAWEGWGHVEELLASILDAVNANTISTGQWKKNKAPKFEAFPRPDKWAKAAAKAKPKKMTLAEVSKFLNRLSG